MIPTNLPALWSVMTVLSLLPGALLFLPEPAVAAGKSAAESSAAPRVLTRVFFQDDDACTLRWADVLDGEPPRLGKVREVAGFPELDPDRQRLVQMQTARGMLLVGVRDDDDGEFQSGWILLETGVVEEEHGDHSHWEYAAAPRVRASVLDEQQGNPAHMYLYDDVFYLANDGLDGYTRLDPATVGEKDSEQRIRDLAAFHQGGGGHITLAVTKNRIGYATWAGRKGENSGRIDVTAVRPDGNTGIALSFNLDYTGLHGAACCEDKVFFAPSDGVCWVQAVAQLPASAGSVSVNHISLGKNGETPRRTGAFVCFERHVVFTSGRGADAELNLIDASAAKPEVVRLPLNMAEGNRPAGLSLVRPRGRSPQAFVFHDHAGGVDAPNLLSLIELNPDGDLSFADARVAQTMEVGNARVEGHGGHHDMQFDADRRWAVFTNPGDGSLVLYSLRHREAVQTFDVGGAPSKLLATGGRGKKL